MNAPDPAMDRGRLLALVLDRCNQNRSLFTANATQGLTPRASAGLGRGDAPADEFDVLLDLEVEHAYAQEIRTAIERVLKPFGGRNRPGSQNLEGDPGDLHPTSPSPFLRCWDVDS